MKSEKRHWLNEANIELQVWGIRWLWIKSSCIFSRSSVLSEMSILSKGYTGNGEGGAAVWGIRTITQLWLPKEQRQQEKGFCLFVCFLLLFYIIVFTELCVGSVLGSYTLSIPSNANNKPVLTNCSAITGKCLTWTWNTYLLALKATLPCQVALNQFCWFHNFIRVEMHFNHERHSV